MNTAFPLAPLVRIDLPAPAQEMSFEQLRTLRVIEHALQGRVCTCDWFCHHCGYTPSGVSETAVMAAIDAHWQYVGKHADRATDPHFEDARLEALLTDQPFDMTRFTAPLGS